MAVELKNNTQIDFIPKMLYSMEQICKDHIERIQRANELQPGASNVNALLSKGLWYPVEYTQTLQKFNQSKRLEWIIKSGTPFHGFMPPTFVPIQDAELPTNRKIEAFKIAKGVIPSDALISLQNSICLIGCKIARDIAVYQTLEDVLGKEKFDLLFASDSKTPLEVGGKSTPYDRLFKSVILDSAASLQSGDFCHFSNIQSYIAKHPFGIGRGYNVICKKATEKDAQFLGLGLKTDGCCTSDVEKALLDAFNAPQYPEIFFLSPILSYVYGKTLLCNEQESKKLVESFKNCTLTQEQFDKMENRTALMHIKAERRMLLLVERPDIDKIEKLVNATLKNIREVFNRVKS